MERIDYIMIGAGLTNATICHILRKSGNNPNILVFEKRDQIGGNCATEKINGIHVHKYGAHIFRTSEFWIWKLVNEYTNMNPFSHKVVVNHSDKLYSFPINLMTLNKLHPEIKLPEDVKNYFEKVCTKHGSPRNLEEQATNLIGQELYEIFVKGYTEKQWGRPCTEIPADVIKRIPVRTTANDKYFDSSKQYEGIPDAGYTEMIEDMFRYTEVILNCNPNAAELKDQIAKIQAEQLREFRHIPKVICSAPIDEFCDFRFGKLKWRSLKFETVEYPETEFYQAAPVVNYTNSEIPYTRIIEHKQFDPLNITPNTIITKEYPKEWVPGDEPYYPVRDEESLRILEKYKDWAKANLQNWHFVGRLGQYAYYDMDVAIDKAADVYWDDIVKMPY